MADDLVFISHNKADKDFARNIGFHLKSLNVDVWFDEWEIQAGESITNKINKGLLNSSHVIIIWSENAKRSNWVTRELNATISRFINGGGSPKILPILMDDTSLPPLLSDIMYISADEDINKLVNKLKASINGDSRETTFNQAIVKKYNEMIFENVTPDNGDPLPYTMCPMCGCTELKTWYPN